MKENAYFICIRFSEVLYFFEYQAGKKPYVCSEQNTNPELNI